MENGGTKSPGVQAEQVQYANKTESAENFQKFIYELFDKNGILNDLRAYLRRHIVNVLKNSQTDEPPSCQRHFTQRLEPVFQALNMLIVEYLLTMEFSYSLSVFVSEIPLANMVFGYARSLMDLGADGEASGLRFKEADVWSILNNLGVKCDSDNANKVVEMYKTQKDSPLLLCILKCIQLHNMDPFLSSFGRLGGPGSVSSESKGSDPEWHRPAERCRHSAFCQNCCSRFNRLKEKYRKKKKHFSDNSRHPSLNPLNVEYFMKKIESTERELLEEMFEQLKSVYEAEVDMVRSEQDEKLKRSLANHALFFEERRTELEESYKARETALEETIEHKKRFLWGLAKALRQQHAQMTRAMQAVQVETQRLADKEKIIQSQQAEAVESLKQHGEKMRTQISSELYVLEKKLESMRTERDILDRARNQLNSHKPDPKDIETDTALKKQYELLNEGFDSLKRCLESSKLERRVVERGTITDLSVDSRVNILNNESEINVVKATNKVVNDLKKQKNVNFNQINIEATRSRPSFEDERAQLTEENEQLRRLAAQQSARIAELSRSARPAASPARRPRTAPPATSWMDTTPSTFGWRKGAGEELTFCIGQSPIVLPGESVPFVGVVGQSRAERLRLLDQIRAFRRRPAPTGKWRRRTERPGPGVSFSSPPATRHDTDDEPPQEVFVQRSSRCNLHPKANSETQPREKSPKSVLREAKEKLRTVPRASSAREQSPSAVLREAKLRLRKLEIEAEAVERSYRHFRRRQLSQREDTCLPSTTMNVEVRYDQSPEQSGSQPTDPCNHDLMNMNLDKYLAKYQKQFDIGQTHFKNRNTAKEMKQPIPEAFIESDKENVPKRDYLEQPLTEFRQLYISKSRESHVENTPKLHDENQVPNDEENKLVERREELIQTKQAKEKELELLQQNITKIYDLHDEPTKEIIEPIEEAIDLSGFQEKNLLKVEFENTELALKSDEDVLLVVASSAEPIGESRSAVDTAPPMAIIVSPKLKDVNEPETLSPSPERLVQKEVFNAFLDAGDQDVSNDENQEPLETGGHYSGGDDYADDFSADVDNYNNKSEYDQEQDSPVSLPKSSEDESFWEYTKHGWRKGAGEELTFCIGQSPIVLPGESVPFVGVVGQSRAERLRLLDQIRAFRRRPAPTGKWRRRTERPGPGVSFSSPPATRHDTDDEPPQEVFVQRSSRCNLHPKANSETQPREKSPKSVLREAKEKLRTVPRASSAREQSPSAVLREAKLRLRKLEIEAEAVERSYRHFRRRQLSQREDTCLPSTTMNVEVRYDQSPEHSGSQPTDPCNYDLMNMNLDKYLAKYQKQFDIGQTHFKNRNTAKEIKQPIPEAFIESDKENVPKRDYLEQPLTEFRQLYISKSRESHVENTPKLHDENQVPNDEENKLVERREELIQTKQAKEKELELLQQNITKIYDLHDEPTKEIIEPIEEAIDLSGFQEKNLLKVEFENTELALKSDEDVLLVVASSAEPIGESRSAVDTAPPMAIIVSPKLKDVNEPETLSPSPERLVQKEVFNAFLDAGDQDVSNDENQEPLETGGHYSGGDDYADDFSADVDNYNNKSEYDQEQDSPVSLPKSSEDESFWE